MTTVTSWIFCSLAFEWNLNVTRDGRSASRPMTASRTSPSIASETGTLGLKRYASPTGVASVSESGGVTMTRARPAVSEMEKATPGYESVFSSM